jgi:hypothetical protein
VGDEGKSGTEFFSEGKSNFISDYLEVVNLFSFKGIKHRILLN